MAAVALMMAVGLGRWAAGDLPHADIHAPGAIPLGDPGQGWLYGASVFIVLRAFANGGSSLTGLEAISNGISVFHEPQGRNARRTLIVMSCVLGFLVLGVSLLAHLTHAIPYADGTPTVIAQEAQLAFGSGTAGDAGLILVQLATALILYTGANTPFTGFPFLASFVAEDRFLPRALTRRGHRLAFSNGIIALSVVALALLLVTGANVDRLVALYAIGVFTAFTMVSAGLTAYHWRRREPGRSWKLAVNASAAVVSAAVVLIFAVTKFTEGAWLVVVVFPLGVWALMRINREYRHEAAELQALPPAEGERDSPRWRRHIVLVLVDSFDLAALEALRYARELRPDEVRAVHIVVDEPRARRLRERWEASAAISVALELVDCPDRRLERAVAELAVRTADADTAVTFLLPRRTYPTVLGRIAAPGDRRVPHQGARRAAERRGDDPSLRRRTAPLRRSGVLVPGEQLLDAVEALVQRAVAVLVLPADEPGRDGGGDHAVRGDADRHHDGGDDPAPPRHRVEVAVADGRRGLRRPPQGFGVGRDARAPRAVLGGDHGPGAGEHRDEEDGGRGARRLEVERAAFPAEEDRDRLAEESGQHERIMAQGVTRISQPGPARASCPGSPPTRRAASAAPR